MCVPPPGWEEGLTQLHDLYGQHDLQVCIGVGGGCCVCVVYVLWGCFVGFQQYTQQHQGFAHQYVMHVVLHWTS